MCGSQEIKKKQATRLQQRSSFCKSSGPPRQYGLWKVYCPEGWPCLSPASPRKKTGTTAVGDTYTPLSKKKKSNQTAVCMRKFSGFLDMREKGCVLGACCSGHQGTTYCTRLLTPCTAMLAGRKLEGRGLAEKRERAIDHADSRKQSAYAQGPDPHG